MTSSLFIRLFLLFSGFISSQAIASSSDIDFIHYHTKLTPSFTEKSLTGQVEISFTPLSEGVKSLSFSAKYKNILDISSEDIADISFDVKSEQLSIHFKQPLKAQQKYRLTVSYQAEPKKGMKFYSDHLFSVYHTRYWMVSHWNLADKASFTLDLTHDKSMTSVANGKLISQTGTTKQQVVSRWQQDTAIPVYTFGFAVGEFTQLSYPETDPQFNYYVRSEKASGLSHQQVKKLFKDTLDMKQFFEHKAGFAMPINPYSYVLVEGYMAQEADGFSLVGEKFAHTLQKDASENWFIAHELAHEWWGNSVTAAGFEDFWLNEGLVQFLVAAYKEHLFGQKAYQREISLALKRVEKARDKNRLAPTAFKSPIAESALNRTMVYSKGALAFHQLRSELGDELFWQGLRHYTKTHQGGTVTTTDLQSAFESVTNKDLNAFFSKWVYGQGVPKLNFVKNKQIFTDFPKQIDPSQKYVFYSHGYIVEGDNPTPEDTRFGWGVYDFPAVKQALSDESYNLIAYHRPANTNPRKYAHELELQVRKLVNAGVKAENITIMGFSRGGFITGLTSDKLSDLGVNTIIMAACGTLVAPRHSDIKVAGHFLSLYEKSDRAQSCSALNKRSPQVKSFNEIALDTGLSHGAFYRPLDVWVKPIKDWIKAR